MSDYLDYLDDVYLDIYETFGDESVTDPDYAKQLLAERNNSVR